MSKDLKVYPVNIDEDQLNVINKYPLLPIPFFLVILGRVKAGKSTLLNSLTLSPRFYGDDFQVKILICNPSMGLEWGFLKDLDNSFLGLFLNTSQTNHHFSTQKKTKADCVSMVLL